MDTKVVRVMGCRDIKYDEADNPVSCTWDSIKPETYCSYIHTNETKGVIFEVSDNVESLINNAIDKAKELDYGIVVDKLLIKHLTAITFFWRV